MKFIGRNLIRRWGSGREEGMGRSECVRMVEKGNPKEEGRRADIRQGGIEMSIVGRRE
jgi:hypothetical protein